LSNSLSSPLRFIEALSLDLIWTHTRIAAPGHLKQQKQQQKARVSLNQVFHFVFPSYFLKIFNKLSFSFFTSNVSMF
jgi:hypothetical protein